jgi:uncharacterized membrane protein YdcZ (DUF606 family)
MSATAESREKTTGRVAWFQRIRDRLEHGRFTSFDSKLALILVTLVYLTICFLVAHRPLWHDELFTYYIAKSPMAQFRDALHLDLNPPLTYLAVRASLAVFGDSELATRVPCILAFLVGSLCLYRVVSKRLRPAYGLLAMLVFWSTPFFYFSTEARPYALVVGFFGVAMLAWQAAVQPRRSALSVLVLGLAVTGMMLSHFFTVFYIAPFCLAEVVRWYRSRKFDLAIWVALLLPLTILLAYIPTLKNYQASAIAVPFQASPIKVVGFFYRSLGDEGVSLLVALCGAMFLVFTRYRAAPERRVPIRAFETAFVVGLLALPAIINFAQMRSHGAAFHRYSAPAVFAYGLLFALFMFVKTNGSRLAAAIACCVLLAGLMADRGLLILARNLLLTGKVASASPAAEPFDGVRPDLPLVAASGLTFIEMDRYADPATVSRLYYLCDTELAIRYAHATIFEGFPRLKKYFPIRANIVQYPEFVAEHPHFLVLGTLDYPEDWLLRRLMDIHADVELLGVIPLRYKDTHLYEINMPTSGPYVTGDD